MVGCMSQILSGKPDNTSTETVYFLPIAWSHNPIQLAWQFFFQGMMEAKWKFRHPGRGWGDAESFWTFSSDVVQWIGNCLTIWTLNIKSIFDLSLVKQQKGKQAECSWVLEHLLGFVNKQRHICESSDCQSPQVSTGCPLWFQVFLAQWPPMTLFWRCNLNWLIKKNKYQELFDK